MRAEDKGEKLSALQAKKVRLVVLPLFFNISEIIYIFYYKIASQNNAKTVSNTTKINKE